MLDARCSMQGAGSGPGSSAFGVQASACQVQRLRGSKLKLELRTSSRKQASNADSALTLTSRPTFLALRLHTRLGRVGVVIGDGGFESFTAAEFGEDGVHGYVLSVIGY